MDTPKKIPRQIKDPSYKLSTVDSIKIEALVVQNWFSKTHTVRETIFIEQLHRIIHYENVTQASI